MLSMQDGGDTTPGECIRICGRCVGPEILP
jgi:hypothetical protein